MSSYNETVVREADAIVDRAIKELLGTSKRGAVIGIAPAGAGKSHAIADAVIAARERQLRVAVGTPTNEQAFAMIVSLATRMPSEQITAVPASTITLPDRCRLRNVSEKKASDVRLDGVAIGTLNKLGDAHARGDLQPFDILLIDEAFQANAVQYYSVGDLAPRHLLVGDSGQLAPFTTAPEGDRWRGLDEDPLLTAIDSMSRHHPETTLHKLPITRRLDPRAMRVVPAFYPSHRFDAAVMPGVRQLTMRTTSGERVHRVEDRILDLATTEGWAYFELPSIATVAADPEMIEWIVTVLRRLFAREPKVSCESADMRLLEQNRVAVVVSHNDQKELTRIALRDAGLGNVIVDTANKLQGLTFEFVVAWHPLAGLSDTDPFHVDPGRLCVMLTRHRHACIVMGRAGDRALVEGLPPATPSYVGWDLNPTLDGWFVHEMVFHALAPYRISLS